MMHGDAHGHHGHNRVHGDVHDHVNPSDCGVRGEVLKKRNKEKYLNNIKRKKHDKGNAEIRAKRHSKNKQQQNLICQVTGIC